MLDIFKEPGNWFAAPYDITFCLKNDNKELSFCITGLNFNKGNPY